MQTEGSFLWILECTSEECLSFAQKLGCRGLWCVRMSVSAPPGFFRPTLHHPRRPASDVWPGNNPIAYVISTNPE
jgi:hypothetical protein